MSDGEKNFWRCYGRGQIAGFIYFTLAGLFCSLAMRVNSKLVYPVILLKTTMPENIYHIINCRSARPTLTVILFQYITRRLVSVSDYARLRLQVSIQAVMGFMLAGQRKLRLSQCLYFLLAKYYFQ